jgi:hypothetical protein
VGDACGELQRCPISMVIQPCRRDHHSLQLGIEAKTSARDYPSSQSTEAGLFLRSISQSLFSLFHDVRSGHY